MNESQKSHGTLRKIEASAKDARAQCLEWSKIIMSVVNEANQ